MSETETKPAASTPPAEAKPIEAKPVTASKPSEVKSVEVKPGASKPASEAKSSRPAAPEAAWRVWSRDVGLFALRVSIPLLLATQHGVSKLAKLGDPSHFPDPLGVGHLLSLILAIFGEFVCAAFIVIGLGTRLFAIPAAFTLFVAAFVVHASDPFDKKEFALLYALPLFVLVLTGPGRISVDAWLWPRVEAWRQGDRGKRLSVK